MPWKKNEDGSLVIDDSGAPVRVDADGKEYPMSDEALDNALQSLSKANSEAGLYRKKARDLESKLEPLKDIEDFGEWKEQADKALETVKNLEDKKLIDAGEMESLKKSISDSFQGKLDEKDKSLEEKDSLIYNLMVTNQFASSQALEKTILTPDIAEAYFGKNFKIEDGQVVGYIAGEKVYSKKTPGQIADFDEALSEIIDNYPMKDKILKSDPGGAGTPPSGGAPSSTVKSKADLKGPKEKAKFISKHGREKFENLPAE